MNKDNLTRAEVLNEAATLLEGWPAVLECVSCGFKQPATWYLHESTYPSGGTAAIEITVTRGVWAGWGTYLKDSKDGYKAGDYCPMCYQTHKKA